MDMSGSEHIGAPVETVWRALNDPEILRRSIPGCQALDKLSETEMTATVVLKIGPLKATFQGSVQLLNLNPPHAYTISGEGTGGIVGFAKGNADVSLVADGPNATILSYTVRADVGGRIAQMGSRLIDLTARKLAGQFFTNLGGKLADQPAMAGT